MRWRSHLSIYLSIALSLFLFVCLSQSFSQLLCLSFCLPICMNVCLSLIHLSTCLPVCLSSIYPLACLSVSQPSIHQNIYVSPFSSFPFSLSTYIYPTYLSIYRPFDRMLTIHVHIYQRHLSPLSPSLASPAVRACVGLGTPATLPSRVIYPHSRHGRVQPVSTCHTHGTN